MKSNSPMFLGAMMAAAMFQQSPRERRDGRKPVNDWGLSFPPIHRGVPQSHPVDAETWARRMEEAKKVKRQRRKH